VDSALYAAKAAGRNCIKPAKPGMGRDIAIVGAPQSADRSH
jgi:hypothetical protein